MATLSFRLMLTSKQLSELTLGVNNKKKKFSFRHVDFSSLTGYNKSVEVSLSIVRSWPLAIISSHFDDWTKQKLQTKARKRLYNVFAFSLRYTLTSSRPSCFKCFNTIPQWGSALLYFSSNSIFENCSKISKYRQRRLV